MTTASDLIWTASDLDHLPVPLVAMPDVVSDYLAAWLATPKHGCGHPGELQFSFDADSIVCGSCAARIGLRAWSICSRCACQLETGSYVTNAALAVERYVIILTLCASCAPDPDKESKDDD
jgi:hypothetical protein